MDLPKLNEWLEMLCQLPNHKAMRSSQIFNEILKHLGLNMNYKLWILIRAVLSLNNVLTQWKKAYIYPIFKPKKWQYQLNNTWPITLLDTVRKTIVKLMTNHLINIFVSHSILKGYNFAALPYSSTFKPLRIIDNLFYDAKVYKKKIWILF